MSTGQDHTSATLLTLCGVMAGAASAIAGVEVSLIGIGWAAAIIGDLWLSPDLDYAMSDATRRWWVLQWIWYPYRCLIPHRSPLSHWPAIGTGLRLGYLCAPLLMAVWVFGLQEFGASIGEWVLRNRAWCVAALVGIEASADVHLLCDVARSRRIGR